jgi:hypothetical protein
MAELHQYFATPVIIDELVDATGLNTELADVILAQRAADPGLQFSNRGGWQSRRDFPRWAGEAGQRLVKHALELANAHTVSVKGKAIDWTVDIWANAGDSGALNMPHVHGGTFWSAVYYVRLGEGSGGELVLYDPRMPGLRMHAPPLWFKGLGPEVQAKIAPADEWCYFRRGCGTVSSPGRAPEPEYRWR